MIELNRLGLGTMDMSIVRNPENSVKTIHAKDIKAKVAAIYNLKATMEAKRKLKKENQFHC